MLKVASPRLAWPFHFHFLLTQFAGFSLFLCSESVAIFAHLHLRPGFPLFALFAFARLHLHLAASLRQLLV